MRHMPKTNSQAYNHAKPIPYTERIEQLKMYGDAPVTVSVSTNTCPLAELKPPAEPAGKFGLTNGNEYWNLVASITFDTFVDTL